MADDDSGSTVAGPAPESVLPPEEVKAAKKKFSEGLGPYGLYPLAMLFIFNMVDEFDRVAFGTLSPEIRDYFGLSDQAFIAITTFSGILPVLLSVPMGYLADRTNRVRISQAGAFIWAITAIVIGAIPVLWVLIMARLIGGVGRLVNEPVHPSLLSDYYPASRLPTIFSIHRWANTAGLIAAPVAGVMGATWGFRPTFIAMAIPTFLVIALSLRLKEPPRGDVTQDTGEKITLAEGFRRIRAIRSLRRTWAAAFLFGAGVVPAASFLNLFFEDVYGMGASVRGFITGITGVGGTIGLIMGERFSRRVIFSGRPHHLPLVTGFMVLEFGIGLFLMSVSPVLVGSIIFAFLLQVGASGFLPSYLTMVALVTPARLRAQAFSYSLLFFALGAITLAQFAGGIGDSRGQRYAIAFLSALVFGGGVVGLTVKQFVARDIEQAGKAFTAEAKAMKGSFLVVNGLDVAYDQVQVLFGVDLEVKEGEILALLGTNGAGKSTLLKAISGLNDPVGGAIYFAGRDITHADANQTARMGIVQVPGGRGIFPTLTVGENLRVAAWMYRKDKPYVTESLDKVIGYFPILKTRWNTAAGSLSGGEQQMLSLAQAFLARPQLLLIDELSLGLAPTVVGRLLDIVRAIHQNGTTIILVEQSVNTALELAERAIFMEKGEVRFEGSTSALLERTDILRAVFLRGAAAAEEQATGNGGRRMTPVEVRERDERRLELLAAPVVLETVGLTKHYGGVLAVNDVDLQLHQGEILGLIGPNGAGKTSLFDLISGFQQADGGRILLHSHDITQRSAHHRARLGLGRSFQDARLWPALTVKEAITQAFDRHHEMQSPIPAIFNLPIVRDYEDDLGRRVEELIEIMGLGAFRDKFISELSTGSRRIVEIAGVLAHRPDVLILDEPSSGIAQKETEALGPLLKEVQSYMDCSMLVIEHDMPLIASLADHLIALDTGTVIARGTPEEVLEHPAVIESYLGTRADKLKIGAGGD